MMKKEFTITEKERSTYLDALIKGALPRATQVLRHALGAEVM